MLPLQDHDKCKKVQLRKFENIAVIEIVGAFEVYSYSYFLLEDKQNF